MKKLTIILSLLLVALLPAAIALAAYSSDILITNTSNTSYDMVAGYSTANISYMAANGIFTSTNGTDTRVKYGTTDQHFMLATDRITYATSIGAHASKTLVFSTGDNASAPNVFSIVPGYGGYVTTNSTGALGLGANFSISVSGYVNTSSGASKYLVRKLESLEILASPTVSQNITGSVYVLPTGTVAGVWTTPNNSWDGDIGTDANYATASGTSSPYLTLSRASTNVNTISFYASFDADIDTYDVGIYDGSWHDSTGNIPNGTAWYTVYFATSYDATQVRYRFHNAGGIAEGSAVFEFLMGKSTSISGIPSGDYNVTLTSDSTNLWMTVVEN